MEMLSDLLASARLLKLLMLAARVLMVAAEVMECCDSLVELLASRPTVAAEAGPEAPAPVAV